MPNLPFRAPRLSSAPAAAASREPVLVTTKVVKTNTNIETSLDTDMANDAAAAAGGVNEGLELTTHTALTVRDPVGGYEESNLRTTGGREDWDD